jgi:hypothetical protein
MLKKSMTGVLKTKGPGLNWPKAEGVCDTPIDTLYQNTSQLVIKAQPF